MNLHIFSYLNKDSLVPFKFALFHFLKYVSMPFNQLKLKSVLAKSSCCNSKVTLYPVFLNYSSVYHKFKIFIII